MWPLDMASGQGQVLSIPPPTPQAWLYHVEGGAVNRTSWALPRPNPPRLGNTTSLSNYREGNSESLC